jgi:MOSC domain-containing protein YiiM
VHTGIWKSPVHGRCRVGRLNLDGDGQGDLAGHGGEQRGVFVYQIESYRYWQEQLKRADFVYGQFGENFTIEGLPDDAAYIGDRYQIGSTLFEVTQPRVTCYRVGIRMSEPRMPALLTFSGRPGFYFRVLKEGEVGAGDEIVKVGEAKERMTVAEINALLYSPHHGRDLMERALRIEALSAGWRGSFEALLQSPASGNAGLVPEAAAHPTAPGFRPLKVTVIVQESADVLSLTMQSPDTRPLPTALPGQYVVLRRQLTGGYPPLFRSYSLSGPVSTERYRISVKIEPNGAAGTYLQDHVRVGITSTSARHAAVSFCSPESGRWCCSAQASGRHLCWRCCTRWLRPAPHGRSYGSTGLAIGSIIHSLPKSAASCSRSHTAAAMSVTAGRPCVTRQIKITMPPVTCRDRFWVRSASLGRQMLTSAGRPASWQT